jgi:hypothetical protein
MTPAADRQTKCQAKVIHLMAAVHHLGKQTQMTMPTMTVMQTPPNRKK